MDCSEQVQKRTGAEDGDALIRAKLLELLISRDEVMSVATDRSRKNHIIFRMRRDTVDRDYYRRHGRFTLQEGKVCCNLLAR